MSLVSINVDEKYKYSSSLSFEEQVSEFLVENPPFLERDVQIEGTYSLNVSRWKDLWIKVPYPYDFEHALEGYLKAYTHGWIDYLWAHESNIITFHVEGIPLEPNTPGVPSMLWDLWSEMGETGFYLADWTRDNILQTPRGLKVIDWGLWTEDGTYAYESVETLIDKYFYDVA